MIRKRRVRIHLADPHPDTNLPSIEGLLIGRGPYFRVAVPQLLIAPGANPAELQDAREVVIPRERIAFYEVLT